MRPPTGNTTPGRGAHRTLVDVRASTSPRRSNRGPAAAADNRAALVEAARRVLSEHGYRAPLSLIAREAGVGQGVLYRHFDSRLDLALAAFESHFVELETIAAEPDGDTFGRLWARLVELVVADAALIELVVDARDHVPAGDLDGRVRRLFDTTLPLAQAAGAARDDLTTLDVQLVMRMLYGVVVTAPDTPAAACAVERCRLLLGIEESGTADRDR